MNVQVDSSSSYGAAVTDEYDKCKLNTSWFILIYIFRSWGPLCLAVQVGFFEVPLGVEYFQKLLPDTYTSILESTRCKGVNTVASNLTLTYEDCQKEHLITGMSFFKNCGYSLGSIIGGPLADLFGRRITSLSFSCLWFLIACILVFLTNIRAFEIFYLLAIMCCSAANLITFVNFAEICHKKYRILSIYTIPSFAVGSVVLHFATKKIKIWSLLMVLNATILPMMIFACWYMPESPRWLMNKNKKQEAYNNMMGGISGMIYNVSMEEVNPVRTKFICYHLVSYVFKKKLKYTLIFLVLFAVASFYYSCGRWQLTIRFVETSEWGMMIFVAEFAGFLFVLPVYFFLGKRYGLLFISILITVGSAFTLIIYGINSMLYYSIFAVMLGMCSLNLGWMYVLDVFPTFARATAVGLCFADFGLVTILGTHVIHKENFIVDFYYYLFFTIVGSFGMLVMLLPYTSTADLPNSLVLGRSF